MNRGFVNIKHGGDFSNHHALLKKFSNLQNILVSEYRHSASLAALRVLANSRPSNVLHIFNLSPGIQMVRPDARWIVAFVIQLLSFWNRTIHKHPRNVVRHFGLSIETLHSVATLVSVSDVIPARITLPFLDSTPKNLLSISPSTLCREFIVRGVAFLFVGSSELENWIFNRATLGYHVLQTEQFTAKGQQI